MVYSYLANSVGCQLLHQISHHAFLKSYFKGQIWEMSKIVSLLLRGSMASADLFNFWMDVIIKQSHSTTEPKPDMLSAVSTRNRIWCRGKMDAASCMNMCAEKTLFSRKDDKGTGSKKKWNFPLRVRTHPASTLNGNTNKKNIV